MSRFKAPRSLGIEPEVVPAHNPQDGINAVRRMLDRTIIDPVRCAEGLDLHAITNTSGRSVSAYGRRIPGMTLRPIAQTLYVVSLPATIRMRRGSALGAHIHNR